MSPNELDKMIRRIKKLPDSLLIRVLRAACQELDERTSKLMFLRTGKREKG